MNQKIRKSQLSILLLTFTAMLVSIFTFGLFAISRGNPVYAHTTANDHIHFNSAPQSGTNTELTFPFYVVHGTSANVGFSVTYAATMSNVYTNIDYISGIQNPINASGFRVINSIADLNSLYENITSKFTYSSWDEYGSEMRFAYSNIFLLTKTNPLNKNLNSKTDLESLGFKTDFHVAPSSSFTNQKGFNFTFNPGLIPDTTSPVLDGWEGVYVTNVDSPVTVASIKALLYAYDDVDGDLTSRITIDSDGYTGHQTVLGSYPIVFSCTDNSNNKATITINIQVVDGVAPVINGASTFTSNMSAPLTVNDIKSTFTVSDNYDTISNSSIIVTSDNFSTNKLIKGTYNVSFEVTDSSGNKGTKTVAVTAVDNIKPIISGTNSYNKGQDAILTLDTIKAGLSASDNCDGTLTSSIQMIEDNYTGNGNRLGSWTIKYRVTDSSGNQSDLFTVTINVSDSFPPVFYVDNSIMHIDSTLSLTQQQIIQILENTGQINLSMAYNASFVIDEYQGSQTPGMYNLSVKVDYSNGSTEMINFGINVINQEFTYIPPAAWYQSWNGWLSQWFGLRIVVNWLFKILGISVTV